MCTQQRLRSAWASTQSYQSSLCAQWVAKDPRSLHVQAGLSLRYAHGERGGSVVECRTPEWEVRNSKPTAAVLCPWARHFTPRKYWLITQEAVAPSRHDWKIVDWDIKPQHKQKLGAQISLLVSSWDGSYQPFHLPTALFIPNITQVTGFICVWS